jgi:hypothetical protein
MIADDCGSDIGYVPPPLYYRKLDEKEGLWYEVKTAFKKKIGPLIGKQSGSLSNW